MRRPGASAAARALDPATLAWLAAVPCALLTVAGIVLLASPLGHALLAPGSEAFWPSAWVIPEPVEHARYLMALAGSALLAIVVLTVRVALPPTTARRGVVVAQVLTAALIAASLMAQNNLVWRTYNETAPARLRFFTPGTLAVALLLPAVALLALGRRTVAERVARGLARDDRRTRAACLAIAAGATALWLATAINTDGTSAHARGIHLIPWVMNETFAVLDGRTPLVNFHAQYAQLWPYVAAGPMALAGSSLGVWTSTMAAISGLALLAVYAVLRRVVRSSPLALGLYLPFLATGFFIAAGSVGDRFSPAGIFSAWPMRYAGPYLLLWLTARHVAGLAPRRAWLLFAAAGLVVLNNPELGIAAFVATCAALAAGPLRPWSGRALARLLGSAAGGLLGACALVSALTLVRAGALPRVGLLLEFPRLYGVDGWASQRMPAIGLHVAMYATCVAALVVAAVATARGAGRELLTAALAWSGTFGMLAASFYVGRSEVLQLVVLLSAWCLALTFLVVVVVRDLAAHAWRRPSVPALLVLFGFGLTVCSLAQVPTPWSQIERLGRRTGDAVYRPADVRRWIASTTVHGQRVAIIAPLGQRLAYDLGLTNVSPYSSVESMPTVQQATDTIALLRKDRVHVVFLSTFDVSAGNYLDEVARAFMRAGFATSGQRAGYVELRDR